MDFLNKAPIAMHWLSGTGHVLWANETELNVLGYTAEEYIGQVPAPPTL
jgi:two-component system sensor histidine kinase VicK